LKKQNGTAAFSGCRNAEGVSTSYNHYEYRFAADRKLQRTTCKTAQITGRVDVENDENYCTNNKYCCIKNYKVVK
jgi:hypothetical protein